MGKHYEESIIPEDLRRTYDVYDRVSELGIDLRELPSKVGLQVGYIIVVVGRPRILGIRQVAKRVIVRRFEVRQRVWDRTWL